MAIEEAFLADQGFTEKLIADINAAAGNTSYSDSGIKSLQEITGLNQYAERRSLNRVSQLQGIFFFIWGSACLFGGPCITCRGYLEKADNSNLNLQLNILWHYLVLF